MSDPALDWLLRDQRYLRLKPMSRYLAIITWASRHMPGCGFARMSRQWLTNFSGIDRDLDACIHNLQQERLIAWHEPTGLMWARGRLQVMIPIRQKTIDEWAEDIRNAVRNVEPNVRWVRRAVQEAIDTDLGIGLAMARHQWQFDLTFPKAPEREDLPTDHSPEVVILSEVARRRAEKAAKAIGQDGERVEKAVEMWNAMAERAGVAPVVMLTDMRRAAMALRLREIRTLDAWAEALGKVEASDFLCGRAGKPFRVDFDWMTNLANLTRVREGKYDTRHEPAVQVRDRGPTNGDIIRRGLADALERRRRMDAGPAPSRRGG